jgi:hypothetical protein
MKKNALIAFSLALAAIGIASCGKTTKGKVTNEWKVTSYEDEETYLISDGSQHVSIISMNETTVTMTDKDTPQGGSESIDSENGVMNKHEFSIKKDGTWSWMIDATFVSGTASKNNKQEQTGTWSFMTPSKEDDFKKNERLIFNVLSSTGTETVTDNQSVIDSETYQGTYSSGENILIYTVKNSKNDRLELELVGKHESSASTISHTQKITLEKK